MTSLVLGETVGREAVPGETAGLCNAIPPSLRISTWPRSRLSATRRAKTQRHRGECVEAGEDPAAQRTMKQRPMTKKQRPDARGLCPGARNQVPESREQDPRTQGQEPGTRSQGPWGQTPSDKLLGKTGQGPSTGDQRPGAMIQVTEARSQGPGAKAQGPTDRRGPTDRPTGGTDRWNRPEGPTDRPTGRTSGPTGPEVECDEAGEDPAAQLP